MGLWLQRHVLEPGMHRAPAAAGGGGVTEIGDHNVVRESVTLNPGAHCQWCRARTQCSAAALWLRREEGGVAALGNPESGALALPEVVATAAYWIAARRPLIEKYWEGIKALVEQQPEVYRRLGLEVVERQGNRYVADPRAAVERLEGVVSAAEMIDLATFPVGKLEELALKKLTKDGTAKAVAKRYFEARLGDALQRGAPVKTLRVREP